MSICIMQFPWFTGSHLETKNGSISISWVRFPGSFACLIGFLNSNDILWKSCVPDPSHEYKWIPWLYPYVSCHFPGSPAHTCKLKWAKWHFLFMSLVHWFTCLPYGFLNSHILLWKSCVFDPPHDYTWIPWLYPYESSHFPGSLAHTWKPYLAKWHSILMSLVHWFTCLPYGFLNSQIISWKPCVLEPPHDYTWIPWLFTYESSHFSGSLAHNQKPKSAK